jgi:phosphate transport system permease protein
MVSGSGSVAEATNATKPEDGVLPPQRRKKTTPRSVILADKIADWTIRIGGIGVIVAVFGIMVFLAQTVVPLFTGARVEGRHALARPESRPALMDVVDEYRTVAVSVDDAGEITVFHIATGRALSATALDLGDRKVTAFARTLSGRDMAFGFDDGSLRLARLSIAASIESADLPPGLTTLENGDLTDGHAVYSPTGAGQMRRISVSAQVEPAQQIAPAGTALLAVDYRLGGTVERPEKSIVTIDAAGIGRLTRSESKTNMMTGEVTETVNSSELPGLPQGVTVARVLMNTSADMVLVADSAGTIYRYATRNFDAPALAETAKLLPDGVALTAMGFLIGEQSIVIGGSDGSVGVYFKLPSAANDAGDGFALVRAKSLEAHGHAVTAIEASQRGKLFLTADEGGEIWLRHSTSEQVLLRLKPADFAGRYQALSLAPRDNGVLAMSAAGQVFAWDIAAPHPETTLKTIFGKVWYEGYPGPTFTWQSSSGTDAFEPKLSLVPLIFGTIKATVYSLLFAVPIALGAAIYTSEFVHPRVRAVVKPVMEMMASLPSVVLGFIAALILAPLVESWIGAVILAVFLVPLAWLLGAFLWQLLPGPLALRYGGLPKFALMFAVLFVAVNLAVGLAPAFERLFFAGDFKAWVNGAAGSSLSFTTLLVLPAVVGVLYFLMERFLPAGAKTWARHSNRTVAGLAELFRWLLTLAAGWVLSSAVAAGLIAVGLDPRGGFLDTYVQRNTLIVGFAMGFAVIPIIYTIAEDALNAVPEHLRGASLGCGATPWQTAILVILPTAMSGVFAAVMVGMGRAVGETMIVVMAAGNTPVMDWNLFNGLRALSANIAVELPEAVKGGTLYRTLFLAALTLFVITFAVNTLAEIVRQRFRKRAAQL